MSAEDLEIHQPEDASSGKKRYLPLKGSLGEELDGLLQRGRGILRGGSLPSLVDASSHPREEGADASPEGAIDTIDHIDHEEQEHAWIKVAVQHN